MLPPRPRHWRCLSMDDRYLTRVQRMCRRCKSGERTKGGNGHSVRDGGRRRGSAQRAGEMEGPKQLRDKPLRNMGGPIAPGGHLPTEPCVFPIARIARPIAPYILRIAHIARKREESLLIILLKSMSDMSDTQKIGSDGTSDTSDGENTRLRRQVPARGDRDPQVSQWLLPQLSRAHHLSRARRALTAGQAAASGAIRGRRCSGAASPGRRASEHGQPRTSSAVLGPARKHHLPPCIAAVAIAYTAARRQFSLLSGQRKKGHRHRRTPSGENPIPLES